MDPKAPSPERLDELWRPLSTLETLRGSEATLATSFRPTEIAARASASPAAALPVSGIVDAASRTVPAGPPSEAIDTQGKTVSAAPPPDGVDSTSKTVSAAPPPAAGAAASSTHDEFRIVDKIGQGGMGEIFRAVQTSLGREVALKLMLGDDRSSGLFIAEARVTGLLEHANIVPVHGLGRSPEGKPHLAMKLVRGTSWGALIHGALSREGREGVSPSRAGALSREGVSSSRAGAAGGALELKDHVKILLAVCNAVAFAHERGVIHRDLKPDNVMVGEHGQVFAMDWGLAVGTDRAACESAGILHVSEVLGAAGTPAYMAPELATGRGAEQDARTDVYLLGACLHEVVTRGRRHEGTDVRTVLRAAVESAPVRYPPGVPRELGEICNRATAARPADRYPSVAAFRAAVEGFLEHEQARVLTAEGLGLLEKLRAAVGPAGPSTASTAASAFAVDSKGTPGDDAVRDERAAHRLYAEVRFTFEHALRIWDRADEARLGLREACRLMIEHAIAGEDLGFALRLLPDVEDAGTRERVEALRARLEARERELGALRDAALRTDAAAIEGPLGTAFLTGAVLGAAAAAYTGRVWRLPDARDWVPAIMAMWGVTVLAVGLTAFIALRRSRVPDSLVSSRMVGTWAAVALACLVNSEVIERLGGSRPAGAATASLMIGIGIVATAFEFRRWLLVPAAAFFASSLVIVARVDWALEIFAAVWLVIIGGVGVALKLGLSLERKGAPGR